MSDDVVERHAGVSEADIEALLALVAGTEVVELEVWRGESQVLLRRVVPSANAPSPVAGAASTSTGPAAGATAPPTDPARQPLAITSPVVGFFHPTVKVGDRVTQGQPLGAIEAMGMPTSVDAPRGGVVEEMLAPDGTPVEYGQPLLVLRPPTDERGSR